ncbi:MAG: DUF4163 domain-containing protein, partial [Lachnospiraceae bacterium]|nr:DUF4163 domain-containing protein [Lachnospiraceae bacterium]
DYKIYDIEEYDRDLFVKAFDYYEGCFYIDVNLGYDENYKSTGEKEYCFVYDEAADAFVLKDAPIDKVTESAAALGFDNLHGTSDRSDYSRKSLTRTLDECGFILANSEKGQVKLDKNGAATPVINDPGEYFFAYDDKYMFYTTWDSNKTSLYCYDVENESCGPVKDDVNTVTFLAYEGGKLYFSDQTQEEYGIKHNHIYEFDEESGKTNLLYEDKSTPGVKIEPGVEGFKVKNGNIFVISYDEGATKWAKVECDGEKPNYKLLDCPVSTIEVFENGKLTYDSATFKCPDCGTPLVMVYAECFELDSKYSKCADKINSVLKDRQQAFIGTDERVQSSSDEDDELYYVSCDEHKEHPEWYQTTEDTYVVKVEIINDRYLAVYMDGYWYGGGAHGMPLRDQDLFDLETGDELTLADLYTGTEEDFKLLIAEKTKEDYLSYDEYELPYYSGDNVDAVYNQAYESAALNGGNVVFTQDGIYYYYPPYEMGPYAAGYIDIFISYKDLLGRDDL